MCSNVTHLFLVWIKLENPLINWKDIWRNYRAGPPPKCGPPAHLPDPRPTEPALNAARMAGHRSDRTVTRLAPARPPPPCFDRPQSRQCPQFHHPPACERRPYPCSFPAKAKNPCLSPPRQATSPSRSLYTRSALCRCASMSHRVKSSRPPPSCSWDLPSSRAPPRATIHHEECPEASRHRLLLHRGCLIDDRLLQSSPGPANSSTRTTPPRSTSASIPALASTTPLTPHSQAPPPNHHRYGETLSSEPLPSPLPQMVSSHAGLALGHLPAPHHHRLARNRSVSLPPWSPMSPVLANVPPARGGRPNLVWPASCGPWA
jgi:hypothetical protein